MKLESIIYDDASDNLWEEAYEIVRDEWLEKNNLSRRDKDEFDGMDEYDLYSMLFNSKGYSEDINLANKMGI